MAQIIQVYTDEKTAEIIKQAAQKTTLSLASFCRFAALQYSREILKTSEVSA
jgi:uncharacterized protein (DUF1778 family)